MVLETAVRLPSVKMDRAIRVSCARILRWESGAVRVLLGSLEMEQETDAEPFCVETERVLMASIVLIRQMAPNVDPVQKERLTMAPDTSVLKRPVATTDSAIPASDASTLRTALAATNVHPEKPVTEATTDATRQRATTILVTTERRV